MNLGRRRPATDWRPRATAGAIMMRTVMMLMIITIIIIIWRAAGAADRRARQSCRRPPGIQEARAARKEARVFDEAAAQSAPSLFRRGRRVLEWAACRGPRHPHRHTMGRRRRGGAREAARADTLSRCSKLIKSIPFNLMIYDRDSELKAETPIQIRAAGLARWAPVAGAAA
jgi:hypothetical protein